MAKPATVSDPKALQEDECWQLLRRRDWGHLAGIGGDGKPLIRPLHHAIIGNTLWFHGRASDRKQSLIGQNVVFSCEEVVASIPSYWRDPIRACPATTYFRNVQVHGRLRSAKSAQERSDAMAALMQKLQPEGGYQQITPDAPIYRGVLEHLWIACLDVEEVSGRASLGQALDGKIRESVIGGLWQRGTPQDLRAIETIIAAAPLRKRPDWLSGPEGCALIVVPTKKLARQAAELLKPQYWNGSHSLDALTQAQLDASAWVGAIDPKGNRLIGTAAALANRSKHAWIYDVAVREDWQGLGVGKAILSLLLDHPLLRDVRATALRTLDAHGLYRYFGFEDTAALPNPTGATSMLRIREKSDEGAR